jgi:hypothetical protein
MYRFTKDFKMRRRRGRAMGRGQGGNSQAVLLIQTLNNHPKK